ncbi:MAG: hypothetical protein Q8838_02595 [Candidatus Phytoplasma australasiaticum]|nr:hypothetical protein [Candidatus Phytoplasma australasiaticum]
MEVATQYGKSTIDPPMPVDEEDVQDELVAAKDEEIGDNHGKDGVSEAADTSQELKFIARTPPSFPQTIKKKEKKGKFKHFLSMFKQLSINIPLIEALEKIQGYAIYIKDLVTKKCTVS